MSDASEEPLAMGERQWREDDTSPVIEVARREGRVIALPVAEGG